MDRITGTVKSFNDNKGYGFILIDNEQDVFVHYRAIISDEYKTLSPGDKVSFLTENTAKGRSALQVKVVI